MLEPPVVGPAATTPEIPPNPTPKSRFGCLAGCFGVFLLLSLLLNCILFSAVGTANRISSDEPLHEKHLYDVGTGKDRIAVIKIEGVLMEGAIHFPLKEIERVAQDDGIRTVVVQISSPGGTISASEDLHRQLIRLRDGKNVRFPKATPKRLIVFMDAIAASGGYYIAMPAEKIFASKTTLTGSIGVYASLPNASDLAEKIGFRMELIKAGGIKASGSPFHEMTPQERQPWQDMVDQAYDQFLDVVVAGRPKLTKADFRDTPLFTKQTELRDDKGNVILDWWGRPRTATVTRYRADGGTFTASEAKKWGLIDEVGELEDAVTAAAQAAGIVDYHVFTYERPVSFLSLFGVESQSRGPDWSRLSQGLTPKGWYLAPGSDLAGIVAGMGTR